MTLKRPGVFRPASGWIVAKLLGAALLLTLALTPSLSAVRCDTDPVPAATLLVPYFQVDLDHPNGRTTLFSITNTEVQPVLANVVLWTDWAVPTLQFEVYLAGNDVQTLNLRDILINGRLPATGAAVSPHGVLSGEPVAFPGCNASTTPGEAPVYPVPALSASERARLQDFHTGRCHDGQRASFFGIGDNVARGYITVDVVERCSSLTPADSGYFGEGGVAGHRNALTGDYFLVDADEAFAQGELAVHVESFPGELGPGDYTFYRRYVAGSGVDGREPLGTLYSFRHMTGGVFDGGTHVIVWRDTGSAAAAPVDCQAAPDWWGNSGLAGYRVFTDEADRACADLDVCNVNQEGFFCEWTTGQATQLVAMSRSAFPELIPKFPFGRTLISTREVGLSADPADWEVLQGWVSVTNSAQGRFSVGQRATRLDSACDPRPIEPPPSQLPDCDLIIMGDP